jgi:hypothetical protein
MIENKLVKDKAEDDVSGVQTGITALRAAQRRFKQDRKRGLAELNELFRSGTVPEPSLSGRYAGELIALDLAPGLTQFFQSLTDRWLPWKGKTFNAIHNSGDNIFTRDSYALARFFNPFYRGFMTDGAGMYRCFSFRTYMAPGLADPDRIVLKIDYDLDGNPAPTVRRILDELVQLDRNLYLGKAHVHWWWGGWQTVAYFLLSGISNSEAGRSIRQSTKASVQN